MPETSAKVAILVAVISSIGAIAAALVAASHNPDPPHPPTPPSTSETPPSISETPPLTPQGVPEEYQGTWVGVLTLAVGNTAGTEQLAYQIGPGRAGEVVGTFQQPQCAGRVVYESGTGPIQFTDQTINNPYGWCSPSVLARAVLVNSNTLSLSLFSGNVVIGQGILRKP